VLERCTEVLAISYGTPPFPARFVLLGQNDLVGGRKKVVSHNLRPVPP
jgi:hypothetical protein